MSTEELAIDRPSFCLAAVSFFNYFIFQKRNPCFIWLYDVKMLFLSHVSCLVRMFSWSERVCVCVCSCFLTPAQVTSCMVQMSVCLSVCVCLHTCTYFLVSVLFSLRCEHTTDGLSGDEVTFFVKLFFFIIIILGNCRACIEH